MVAHLSLFTATDCHTMIAPNPPPPFVPPIASAGGLKLLSIPSANDLLEKEYPYFPYDKTYEQAKDDPLVVLHTSGTTGLPKPIFWTHDWASAFGMWNGMPAPKGYSKFTDEFCGPGIRCFVGLPPFHVSFFFVSSSSTNLARLAVFMEHFCLPDGNEQSLFFMQVQYLLLEVWWKLSSIQRLMLPVLPLHLWKRSPTMMNCWILLSNI